jgi:hypothetical protein
MGPYQALEVRRFPNIRRSATAAVVIDLILPYPAVDVFGDVTSQMIRRVD